MQSKCCRGPKICLLHRNFTKSWLWVHMLPVYVLSTHLSALKIYWLEEKETLMMFQDQADNLPYSLSFWNHSNSSPSEISSAIKSSTIIQKVSCQGSKEKHHSGRTRRSWWSDWWLIVDCYLLVFNRWCLMVVSQLSTVNCQLSIVNLLIVNYW